MIKKHLLFFNTLLHYCFFFGLLDFLGYVYIFKIVRALLEELALLPALLHVHLHAQVVFHVIFLQISPFQLSLNLRIRLLWSKMWLVVQFFS